MSETELSELELQRVNFIPEIPHVLKLETSTEIEVLKPIPFKHNCKRGELCNCNKFKSINLLSKVNLYPITEKLRSRELRLGILMCGGNAPGGDNIITGLYKYIQARGEEAHLIGFKQGFKGLIKNKYVEIIQSEVNKFRNQGGLNFIGTARYSIIKTDYNKIMKTVKSNDLDGLVICASREGTCCASKLTNYFISNYVNCKIIVVPKTIDNDMRNEYIETCLGFDTVTKVYSELIGNIMIDALSSKKYYHIIRLMGGKTGHIAIECALQTHPNCVLIGEELEWWGFTLQNLFDHLTLIIVKRFEQEPKKQYGVFILSEGLIEHLEDMKRLFNHINLLFQTDVKKEEWTKSDIINYLDEIQPNDRVEMIELVNLIPTRILENILLTRSPFGEVQVSKIQTEKLVKWGIRKNLETNRFKARVKPSKGPKLNFQAMTHFFGYEGRGSLPSDFDSTYGYSLGITAGRLIANNCNGLMAVVNNLNNSPDKWTASGIPLSAFLEYDKSKNDIIYPFTVVDMSKLPYITHFKKMIKWRHLDAYQQSGPLQFNQGSIEKRSKTLYLEYKKEEKEKEENPQQQKLNIEENLLPQDI